MRKLATTLSVLSVFALALTSACSSGTNGADKNIAPSADPSASKSPAQMPMGKYDPPIELTTVRTIQPTQYFSPGETIDNNAIYDYYAEKLGVTIKNKWTVTKDYDTKLKIAIASDDLPDFFRVSPVDLVQLVENDMIADLTQLWKDYATDDLKKWVSYDGGIQMASATFNGKLMAIPQTRSGYSALGLVYIRKDWLKEMNLAEPKTVDDLLKISKAFAGRDTGGKGKAYGLFMDKTLPIANFLNMYHVYPKIWVKDSAGNLSYGSIDPKMKDALAALQKMFKEGQIDPEFGVKDRLKEMELVANNRIGMLFGRYSDSVSLTGAVVDGKVVQEWDVYMLPSIDSKPAMSQATANVTSYFVASKKSKHPEGLIKITNLYMDSTVNSNAENSVLTSGKERRTDQIIYEVNPIYMFGQLGPVEMGQLIPKAVKAKDQSILKGQWGNVYNNIMKFMNGEVNLVNYANYFNGNENGTLAKVAQGYDQKLYKFDEFTGAPTPTMGDKMATLLAKEDEVITKIIMGSLPVEAYDAFISDWKRLGGDQITQEVNKWAKGK
ncbi:extracellular solute-binding protein [Paenibacillus koleovorans]|uniref:extracellular solute-binding protein n=1 Tax=Paenibacillus koleovorans TaxID=121608 RepID=UPI000FD81905|nr:extracellular solute-binding protein [Paenibacillus koleovorans]